MEDNKELKEIQENYTKVKQSIGQKDYYLNIKDPILTWAKHYSEYCDKGKYLYELLPKIMTEQKLSRLQAYALVGLVSDLIYDADSMNDDIDSALDSLFSGINGDCIKEQVFTFPDDPPGEDHQHYAWSQKWKLWKMDDNF